MQRGREQLPEAVHLRHDPQQVVVDVPDVAAQLLVDHREVTAREPVHGGRQWGDGAVEVEHLALEPVDPLGRVQLPVVAEHLLLDLLDVGVDALDDGLVVVHDPVEDRVQDRAGPV